MTPRRRVLLFWLNVLKQAGAVQMTVDEIRAKIQEIAAIGLGDPERAHCDEDTLRDAVLRSIAKGTCEDPQACAAEVLKTEDLDFPRWYA